LKLYTKNEHVILASSSQTRISYLKKYFRKALAVQHKVDEIEIKKENKDLDFRDLVKLLAKRKAQSIMKNYPESIIIGSDQLLVCDGKLFNKSKNISEARSNLIKLKGKKHRLISSTYAMKNQKPYFEETKEAEMLFKNVSQIRIEKYLTEKKKEVLMSVGSYRIEDNKKYNFLKILKGDHETIIGFPLINLKNKFMEDTK
jgi:septum formation protein